MADRLNYARQSEDRIHLEISQISRRMETDALTLRELTAALIIKKRDRKAATRVVET